MTTEVDLVITLPLILPRLRIDDAIPIHAVTFPDPLGFDHRVGAYWKSAKVLYLHGHRMKSKCPLRKLLQMTHMFHDGDIGAQQDGVNRAFTACGVVNVERINPASSSIDSPAWSEAEAGPSAGSAC